MIIQSLSLITPSRRITNGDVVESIKAANHSMPEAQVTRYCRQLERLLVRMGANTRYFRNREAGETALSLIVAAARAAMNEAALRPTDIDLLIYCGVGRGFLEPANAAFISRALGLRCDSFDIADACMSWVRSLHVAYSFLTARAYSRIMIVSGEFTVYENGMPEIFRIRRRDQLRYTFPAFTVGEAAAATVLLPSSREWRFRFSSDFSLAPLCSVPLPGYQDFAEPDDRVGLNGIHQLTSFGQELSEAALDRMIPFVQSTFGRVDSIDWWFPHAASATLCRTAASRLGLGERLYRHVFPCYGNLISASVPAAMAMALGEGKLERGHRFVLCPVSAGMSFALVEAEY